MSNDILYDAGGRLRTSGITTLFDGKNSGLLDTNSWDTAGTGTATYSNNKVELSVTAGQYVIYQSKVFVPYFSGKSQIVELTTDNFDTQSGLFKRAGYFSSSINIPYTANLDGVWLEDDGTTKRFVMYRDGTQTFNVPLSAWKNSAKFDVSYNWSKFTVCIIDFLWLGGAIARLFIKHPHDGFVLAHEVNWAGSEEDIFFLNPAQPIRYEIRSTTGTGDMRAICSTVGSEGSFNKVGKSRGEYSSLISTNSTSTTYAVLGVKGDSAFRYTPVNLTKFGGVVTTSDSGTFLICRNPTLSADLTWTDYGSYLFGKASAGQTVSNVGRIIDVLPINASGVTSETVENILTRLSYSINGTADTLVLAYVPATVNQSVVGSMLVTEY